MGGEATNSASSDFVMLSVSKNTAASPVPAM